MMRNSWSPKLWLLLCAIPAFAEPEEQWATARLGNISLETPAVGSFQGFQTTHLGPQVSGRVQEVLVDVGDAVKKGQELVRLDPTFFQIEVDQRKADLDTVKARIESSRQSIKTAEAEVQIARAGLEDAELELQRMKSLWEKPQGEAPSIPKRMYDEAAFNRTSALGRVESAQSRLAEAQGRFLEASSSQKLAEQTLRYAEKRLAETVIRAPYAAVVTQRFVDAGEPVNSMPVTKLLEIKDVSRLDLEFSLPQSLYSQIRVGMPIEYEVDGVEAGKGQGQISMIHPDMDEQTRSFWCRVSVENADRRYAPGLLVRVRVMVEKSNVTLVPVGALQQIAGAWKVETKEGLIPVEVGFQNGQDAEIRSGLKEGAQVLVQKF